MGQPRTLQTHCRKGHELAGDNLYDHVTPEGKRLRYCRACRSAWASRYRKAHPDKFKKGMERFRAKNPHYMRDYYRKIRRQKMGRMDRATYRLFTRLWWTLKDHQPPCVEPIAFAAIKSASWFDSIAIYCRDGRWRRIPLEPQLQPLASGLPTRRVGLLRGAGNAIVPQLAAEFIKAVMGLVE